MAQNKHEDVLATPRSGASDEALRELEKELDENGKSLSGSPTRTGLSPSPTHISAQNILDEFEVEKTRLVAKYTRKRAVLDSKGVFDPSINNTRAENMLLSAIGKVNMLQLERRAREKVGRTTKQVEVPKRPTRQAVSVAERLERKLDEMYEQAMASQPNANVKQPGTEARSRRRRASLTQGKDGRRQVQLPPTSHTPNPQMGGGRRGDHDNSTHPTTLDSSAFSAKTGATSGQISPRQRSQRSATTDPRAEVTSVLNTTRTKTDTLRGKLHREETHVTQLMDRILEPHVALPQTTADFMEKSFEHRRYPTEAILATHMKKKKLEKKHGAPRAASSAAMAGTPRLSTGDGIAPTTYQIWTQQSAKIPAERLFNAPFLGETTGELKTISATPLLPDIAQPSVDALMGTIDAQAEAHKDPPPIVSPRGTAEKFPGDKDFVRRTARATTLAQRELRRYEHEQLEHNQAVVHPDYKLPTVVGEPNVPVDDVYLPSDSDSEPYDPTDVRDEDEDAQQATQLLEEVIVFLCNEFKLKQRCLTRGQKDIVVLRNILMQCLKALLPYLDRHLDAARAEEQSASAERDAEVSPTSLLRSLSLEGQGSGPELAHSTLRAEPSAHSGELSSLRTSTVFAAAPVHTRTVRSWTKGVEVMLTWELGTDSPFNPRNPQHLRLLAENYCAMYRQLQRRTEQLMQRWREHKVSENEQKKEDEQELEALLARNEGADDNSPGKHTATLAREISVRRKRRRDIAQFLQHIAADGMRPESKAVQQFLLRFNELAGFPGSSLTANHSAAAKRWRRAVFDLLGVMQRLSVDQRDQCVRRVLLKLQDQDAAFANVFRTAVGGSALLDPQGAVGQTTDQKMRTRVLVQTDLLDVINKYMKMSSGGCQAEFKLIVQAIKASLQGRQVPLPEDLPDEDAVTELEQKRKQQEAREESMHHRMLEVERDLLIRKYATDQQKNERVKRFHDLLKQTDAWSGALKAPVTTEGAAAEASKRKYNAFKHLHDARTAAMGNLRTAAGLAPHNSALSGLVESTEFADDSEAQQRNDLTEEEAHERHMRRLEELDVVWTEMKLEFQQKMTLYEKYDALTLPAMERAVEYWRKAAALIGAREVSLRALETFEASAAEARKGNQEPAARLEEEKKRSKLFSAFCKAGQLVEALARKMELDVGDIILYRGGPYLVKLKADYNHVLALLERQRLSDTALAMELQPTPEPSPAPTRAAVSVRRR